MESIWNDIERPQFETLNGDVKTDVLIIGGGLCGILCGYMLKKAGVDCIIAEMNRICSGVTNGTTAKITFQHGLIYDKLINKYGLENALIYYLSQKDAFERLKALCMQTDCDFEIRNSFVYSLNNRKTIEKEAHALNKLGCDARFCTQTELPFETAGAVRVDNQASFHPLKLAFHLAKDLKIYENTKITGLESHRALADNGRIYADKIIVASHFPFINRHGGYFVKMYQHRSYVLALKNAVCINDMYVDEAKDGLSFRSHGDLLLLGGGSHRTGGKGGNWACLESFKDRHYPRAQEAGRWATQDCMTLDSVPYIGRYSKSTPDLYTATGFNKWGMTSSMVSALILTDAVCGIKNEYADIYSPDRSILHPQLAVNIFESAKALMTPSVPRCPHMGCALKYNRHEHSWDCPCHGSRFQKNGELINNPSLKDKKMGL